jgi:hypothetical protein
LLAPKTEQESDVIRNIIRLLKAKHLPTYAGNSTNLFFNYPALCKPSFSLGQKYLTDFKYCVIKSVNVSYSPQGEVPSFYSASKAPVFIALSIQLEEIQYQLSKDYGGALTGPSAASAASGVFDNINKVINSQQQPGG